VFGAQIRFDLAGGAMPLLTTKRVYWKTATRELLWFLTGDTNIRALCAQGVEIWTDWPLDRYRRETGEAISREDFLRAIVADGAFAARMGRSRSRSTASSGSTGRSINRRARGCSAAPHGINQVAEVVESLRAIPAAAATSSKGGTSPSLTQMALPPCHKTYQFHVADGRLSGLLYQRSCDVAPGPAVQPVGCGAADADAGAAVRSGTGRGWCGWAAIRPPLSQPRGPGGRTAGARAAGRRQHWRSCADRTAMFDYRIEDFEVRDYAPQAPISLTRAFDDRMHRPTVRARPAST
jgi:thymidylate synthase